MPQPLLPEPGAVQTPMAPSVEKAYYRKCIQLKRRLNDVEKANDEARLTRVRLDRSVMKMRLERAFLLDELRKRMEYNVDGSEGSGDEGLATPPPDRPHRDKRRRPEAGRPTTQPPPAAVGSHAAQHPLHSSQPPSLQQIQSPNETGNAPTVPNVMPVNSKDFNDGALYAHDNRQAQAAPPQSSSGTPMNLDGRDEQDRDARVIRASAAAGERPDSTGDRIMASSPPEGHKSHADGFTSVNQA